MHGRCMPRIDQRDLPNMILQLTSGRRQFDSAGLKTKYYRRYCEPTWWSECSLFLLNSFLRDPGSAEHLIWRRMTWLHAYGAIPNSCRIMRQDPSLIDFWNSSDCTRADRLQMSVRQWRVGPELLSNLLLINRPSQPLSSRALDCQALNPFKGSRGPRSVIEPWVRIHRMIINYALLLKSSQDNFQEADAPSSKQRCDIILEIWYPRGNHMIWTRPRIDPDRWCRSRSMLRSSIGLRPCMEPPIFDIANRRRLPIGACSHRWK